MPSMPEIPVVVRIEVLIDPNALARLDQLHAMLETLIQKENRTMSDLATVLQDDADLLAEVQTIGTDSAAALMKLNDVETQLTNLQNSGLSPAQQAQLDQLHTDLTAAKASLTSSDSAIQAALNPPAATSTASTPTS